MIVYDCPEWAVQFPELVIAQSKRQGGCSPAPWTSLNLGVNTNDDPDSVHLNKMRFANALAIDVKCLATTYQVHGTEVQNVLQPGHTEGYDALVTNKSNIFVGVTIADCTPILIYDPVKRVVAAIHAGWRGTVGQITTKTIQRMQQHYGCEPVNCWTYIGTCIGKDDFEVDKDVAQYFTTAFKYQDTQTGKYYVDLKAVNREQLMNEGVPVSQIEQSSYSTLTANKDYFSYRYEKGRTGRMLALVGFRN